MKGKLIQFVKYLVKYNNSYFYNKKTRNCQGFVRKITDSLEINLCFEGEMKREFEYFKENLKLDYKFKDR